MDDRLEHYVFMFVDVVRYSTLSSEDQLAVGNKLSRIVPKTLLGQQLEDLANGVFLSTGDGFALGFLNHLVQANPRYAIDLATELQQKMAPLRLRIGLHVGKAQPYADFNSRFYQNRSLNNNIAGPGINVAQRVMNLGDAGDILASGEFVTLFRDAAPQEADEAFHYLGRIRVKHGLELDIHKVGDDVPPTRVKNYTHAQTTIKSLLRHICDAAVRAAHPSCRDALRPRASVLAYDPATNNLYVSTSRVGYDLSDPPERSKAKGGMMAKRRKSVKPRATATIAVVPFPYYEDFYVERVSKPVGLAPSDEDDDTDKKRDRDTKRRQLTPL